MLRHIISWNHRENLSEDEKRDNAQKIKTGLEALVGVIDGLLEMKVYTETLPTSNRDILISSLFENEETLEYYQYHPEHQKMVAFIKSVTCNRSCADFYE